MPITIKKENHSHESDASLQKQLTHDILIDVLAFIISNAKTKEGLMNAWMKSGHEGSSYGGDGIKKSKEDWESLFFTDQPIDLSTEESIRELKIDKRYIDAGYKTKSSIILKALINEAIAHCTQKHQPIDESKSTVFDPRDSGYDAEKIEAIDNKAKIITAIIEKLHVFFSKAFDDVMEQDIKLPFADDSTVLVHLRKMVEIASAKSAHPLGHPFCMFRAAETKVTPTRTAPTLVVVQASSTLPDGSSEKCIIM